MMRKSLQIVAWSELLGGAAGLFVLLPIAALQHVASLGPGYYVIAVAGFSVAIAAGWGLLRHRPLGRPLSLVVQSLQVVQCIAGSWMIQYATGVQVLLKLRSGNFQFSPGVNAAIWFGPTLVPAEWMIGLNLYALWALWVLLQRESSSLPEEAQGVTSTDRSNAAISERLPNVR